MSQSQPRKRSTRVACAAAAAAVAVAAVTVASSAAQAATGPTVSSWVTAADRSQLLSPQPSVVFSTDGSRPGDVITVDPSQTFQTMDGFGASITDSSSVLLYNLPEAQRDTVMRSIFSPSEGIGMSFLRQPIGASDYVQGPHYTYNDLPAGQSDLAQTTFSVAHDEAKILPLVRTALQLNPGLKVMASPWSAPAWMKANGSLIGGRLKDDPAIFHSYALYLLKFVQAYEARGVPIYAISIQNEPQNRTPDSYPGMDLPVAHQDKVIGELGPLLRDAGLSRVKIISYDHNWAQHPDDAADAAALGVPPEPNYPYDALRAPNAQWIAGTGYHHYAGEAGAMTALHDAFPTKDIWLTEASGWRGINDAPAKVFSDTLQWHIKNVQIASVRNWAKGVLNWNLALNSQGGPVNGGCGVDPTGVCTGVITIDGTTVTRNAEYYAIGHMSKATQQGAVRIGSNNAGDVQDVAFKNPNGTITVVAANTQTSPRTFGISYSGMFVSATLPAGGVGTYTWAATGSTPTPTSTPKPTVTPTTTPTPTPTTTTPPAAGSCTVVSGSTYRITSASSGKALDVRDNSTANGAAIQQWTYGGGSNQKWVVTATSGGYYKVVSTLSGKALDVAGVSTANGAGVQQWDYSGGGNQQWRLNAVAGGCTLTAKHSGKALDVRDNSTADGAGIQQWDLSGGANQRWTLTAVS
ncbi:RICIN domain-containing protein [Cellulomonas sp. URHD0024]|uniref:RICIN domain-containing protein n=2 Tax=Cellulomonas sp. URHD0024 TaxID=1302620 RepID=UPI0004198BA1|nr:RICIN domain-containing protein [Cellulomonas sp. URHD0024]